MGNLIERWTKYRRKACINDSMGQLIDDTIKEIEGAMREVERLRSSLTEIRDVAKCSEGVEFYAMLADEALKQQKPEEDHVCVICGTPAHIHNHLSHPFKRPSGTVCLDCGRRLKGTPIRCPICNGGELHYSSV